MRFFEMVAMLIILIKLVDLLQSFDPSVCPFTFTAYLQIPQTAKPASVIPFVFTQLMFYNLFGGLHCNRLAHCAAPYR